MTTSPQRNWLIFLAVFGLATTAAGCAMTFDASSLGVPVSMASPAARPAVGDTFNIKSHAVFLFWGMYASTEPSLQRTLEGQLGGGRGVQDLRIHVHHRWTDVLIAVLSAGLVTPVSVTFQGVIAPQSP